MWLVITAILVAMGIAAGVMWYACSVPSSQVFGPALVHGPIDGRLITLTFDDGPASPFTEQILDILRERRVSATFFICGKNAERAPEILRRILAEGHTVGNHTYSHPFLYLRSRAAIAEEIDRAQEVIHKITGYRPEIFRPPYGGRWFGLVPVLQEREMRLVQWSNAGYDWRNESEAIVRATLQGLRPGSIILLHDGDRTCAPPNVDRSHIVRALPSIIDGALKMGFKFVPIREFL